MLGVVIGVALLRLLHQQWECCYTGRRHLTKPGYAPSAAWYGNAWDLGYTASLMIGVPARKVATGSGSVPSAVTDCWLGHHNSSPPAGQANQSCGPLAGHRTVVYDYGGGWRHAPELGVTSLEWYPWETPSCSHPVGLRWSPACRSCPDFQEVCGIF